VAAEIDTFKYDTILPSHSAFDYSMSGK